MIRELLQKGGGEGGYDCSVWESERWERLFIFGAANFPRVRRPKSHHLRRMETNSWRARRLRERIQELLLGNGEKGKEAPHWGEVKSREKLCKEPRLS